MPEDTQLEAIRKLIVLTLLKKFYGALKTTGFPNYRLKELKNLIANRICFTDV